MAQQTEWKEERFTAMEDAEDVRLFKKAAESYAKGCRGESENLLSPDERIRVSHEGFEQLMGAVLEGRRSDRGLWRRLLFWKGTLFLLVRKGGPETLEDRVAGWLEKTGRKVVRVVDGAETLQGVGETCEGEDAPSPWWKMPGRIAMSSKGKTGGPTVAALSDALLALESPGRFFEREGPELEAARQRWAESIEAVDRGGYHVLRSWVNGCTLAVNGLAVSHEDEIARACVREPWKTYKALKEEKDRLDAELEEAFFG